MRAYIFLDDLRSSDVIERVAYVIGDTKNQRLYFDKEVKRLYTIRSRIVHSGHIYIDDSDEYLFRRIAYESITRLLARHDEFQEISDLIDWVKSEKYS